MKIQIIGFEKDPNFQNMLQNILHAIHELQIEATVDEVTNVKEIGEYPLTPYPAMYVDGEFICNGECNTLQHVKECLNRKIRDSK